MCRLHHRGESRGTRVTLLWIAPRHFAIVGVFEALASAPAVPGEDQSPTMKVEMNLPMFSPRPIGSVRSPYTKSADIPKGLGAKHEAEGVLEILPEFATGLLDVEGFSHLFVLWMFDRSEGFDLVGSPPFEKRPHGVFATRSPRRPNPIGLTVVELLRREGNLLHVRGVDMLDGTPILDIKPYMSSVPPEKLRRGWLADAEAARSTNPS